MKKSLLIIVVFALQNCVTMKGTLELIENENKVEALNQQVTFLQQKCNNLAVSLSQINGMLPSESVLPDGKIIYQEVNRVLAGNGYPQLQRQVVIPPIPAIPPVKEEEK